MEKMEKAALIGMAVVAVCMVVQLFFLLKGLGYV